MDAGSGVEVITAPSPQKKHKKTWSFVLGRFSTLWCNPEKKQALQKWLELFFLVRGGWRWGEGRSSREKILPSFVFRRFSTPWCYPEKIPGTSNLIGTCNSGRCWTTWHMCTHTASGNGFWRKTWISMIFFKILIFNFVPLKLTNDQKRNK